ncbi:hypothetical protein ACRALDRAFT_2061501 [Sodiomyces alcalophilus JCM 7366]|uniref:uncharacterized protein n=1 Tax=Sodiomyces alcalophilus JCM 7366 TaxID=591952 RepID=UPI0039B60FE7
MYVPVHQITGMLGLVPYNTGYRPSCFGPTSSAYMTDQATHVHPGISRCSFRDQGTDFQG